eukprot:TRINITY_DN6179_c0_g1_i2.p1 TRINITY_DN6179_c0_g1~~TRINITY_DN6179_c0_g1_i2.p1  ORF type:complete len:209 (+),score=36.61 TRINITY_DN6179_c0_g1_i2:269-895(+)
MKTDSSIPLGWMTEILEPEELSAKMQRFNQVNLNTISHNAAINLIRRALHLGINVQEIYVDTVGVASKYQAKLEGLFPGIAITVSKKADSLFPVVSAASIVAKVVRDYRLKHWEFKEGEIKASTQFGSGYPGDPTTITWLQNNSDQVFGFPSIIRFSWKTTKEIINKTCVDVIWDEDDMEESELRTSDRRDRYKFFAENNMELVTDFE